MATFSEHQSIVRSIVEAERKKQADKTARLRKARLEKEAADLLDPAPGDAGALRAKGKKA